MCSLVWIVGGLLFIIILVAALSTYPSKVLSWYLSEFPLDEKD